MLWHTFSQPLGIQFVTACFCGGGVLERFPDLRGRAARGQLLVGAVVPVPARRALRVDGLVRGARAHDEAVRLLPAQLLDLGGGRRGHRDALHRHVRRTTGSSFSTDYPHGDSKFPHAVDAFDKLPMSDAAKAATVSTNWSDLYKIPLVKQV